MKKIYAFLFVLIFPFLVLAQDGKPVAVTAEKEVPIEGNNVSAARTIALAMAARDAVEKAYGVYVKVEELPDARRVMTQAAAGLKYQVLAEQQRGNKYWVKIQASVIVPDEYVGDSAADEREGMGEDMRSLVQKYPQGEINWGDALILAYGKGEIETGGSATAEEEAARAAEVDAKGHLLEILKDIPLDDRDRIGQNKRVTFALEGFVQNAEVVARARSGKFVNVTVQAPIRGVKGLTMTLMGYYTPPPPPPPPKNVPVEIKPAPIPQPEKFTGVVIDARKTSVAAAVFPKVQDPVKREVYDVKKVNQEDLQRRGMASYAVVSREASLSKMFPNATIILASYSPEEKKPAAPQAKLKRRQGYNPMVVSATAGGGNIKANLIVSEEDAQKIKALDEKTSVLKEARVVVVLSSEVGGLEGFLLPL